MTSDITAALRARYMHRFRQHDTDGDGRVTAADFDARATRLVRALGVPDDAPAARELRAGARHMWEGLWTLTRTEHAPPAPGSPEPPGPGDALTEAAFVTALARARAEGTVADLVGPSVAAHLALVDADGDGAVSLREFTAGQTAMGQSEAEAAEAFAAMDGDADGVLSTEEWLAAVLDFYTAPGPRTATTPGDLVLGHRP